MAEYEERTTAISFDELYPDLTGTVRVAAERTFARYVELALEIQQELSPEPVDIASPASIIEERSNGSSNKD